MFDAVKGWVAHNNVGRGHVYFGSQHVSPVFEFAGYPEIQADGFGMADVQIPVGLWRKARVNASVVFSGLQIDLSDVFDKIWWMMPLPSNFLGGCPRLS